MIGSVDIKTNQVKFSEVKASERPFAFRLPDPEKDLNLRAEIAMLGLLYPITVEAAEPNQYVIIDGHRRFDAIRSLRLEAGGWDDIPAVVYSASQLLTHEKLILLKEKNMSGENAYAVYEKARLLDAFRKRGLSVEEMAEHAQIPQETVDLLLYLAETSPGFAALIMNNIPEEFALSLIKRHRLWTGTSYKDYADAAAQKIVRHLQDGKMSALSWKFLLDF